MNDTELELFQKAEALAAGGNARLADAIRRLEDLNMLLHRRQTEVRQLQQAYAQLERAIIDEAADSLGFRDYDVVNNRTNERESTHRSRREAQEWIDRYSAQTGATYRIVEA